VKHNTAAAAPSKARFLIVRNRPFTPGVEESVKQADESVT
jgi:hypothetical protein